MVKWVPPTDLVAELNADTTSDAHKRTLRKRIVKQTRSFVGFMQYLSCFIPRFSALAATLFDQLKEPPPDWTDNCTLRWEQLKTCLARATLMYHPNFSLAFHVYFDGSLRGVSGLLAQDIDGAMHPVDFCARALKSAEISYSTTEQEFLAMVFCFCSWRCDVEGSQIFAHTDH